MAKLDKEDGEPPSKMARLEQDKTSEIDSTSRSEAITGAINNLQKKLPSLNKTTVTRALGNADLLVNSHHEEDGAVQLTDEMTRDDDEWYTDDDNDEIGSDEEGDVQHQQNEEREKIVLVGMQPLHKCDNTPCQYINPYFGDNTCQGAEKSSLFWLGKIREVYVILRRKKDRRLFVLDMISQAHPCLHKNYHMDIINALTSKCTDDDRKVWYPRNVLSLNKKYKSLNKKFDCTCGSWIIHDPQTYGLQEAHDIHKTSEIQENEFRCQISIPPQLEQNNDPCKYINPYLGDTTCKGAEKSSLFWLDTIRKVYYDPNRIQSHDQMILFVKNMIFQAHACLHKNYHSAIINALVSIRRELKIRFPQNIYTLIDKYKKYNMRFVCTCRTWVIHDKETYGTLESRDTPDSCESKEDNYLDPDFTYDDILEALGLDDC